MGDISALNHSQPHLARLLGYLESDPDNLRLIGDAVSAALDVRQPGVALDLIRRYEAIAPLTPVMRNFEGLAALHQDRFDAAADIFQGLLSGQTQDPGLRFNLAWCKSITGDHAGAAGLLDDATVAAIPAAASLKVQALHRQGDLDEALAEGTKALEIHPADTDLLGALSMVAIDLQMPELAQGWAAKAQDTSDGLSTLGMLVLQDDRLDEAMGYFDRGLAARADSPRNWLGKGLVLMARGDAAGATECIDRSAELFGRHLGTWIASGWAHFAAGDRTRARGIFEHALALDDTFAESHGALAVLDVLDGDIDGARRRTDTALRLDRRCFSGALAKVLLLEHDGDMQAAQRVRDIALNTPVGESGRTIAQAVIALAPRQGGRQF
ncbi:tetratricopeptide repeat protein [Asticcacaulis solisilvae]|uniref:tetratricopeptide repeat protein n=1 Tax=Asticcacaulis solisilvae TaxID=1217274 RepID=UPI003FD6C84A